jgi:hypothetical protein
VVPVYVVGADLVSLCALELDWEREWVDRVHIEWDFRFVVVSGFL